MTSRRHIPLALLLSIALTLSLGGCASQDPTSTGAAASHPEPREKAVPDPIELNEDAR